MEADGPGLPSGEKLRRLARGRGELASELGREPTEGEIARRPGWSKEEARFAMTLLLDVISLDRPAGAGEGAAPVGELVADGRERNSCSNSCQDSVPLDMSS